MLTLKQWCELSAEPGPFKVTRWCCSGNCIKCRAGHVLAKRLRVVQMANLNKAAAEAVLAGWSNCGLEPRIER